MLVISDWSDLSDLGGVEQKRINAYSTAAVPGGRTNAQAFSSFNRQISLHGLRPAINHRAIHAMPAEAGRSDFIRPCMESRGFQSPARPGAEYIHITVSLTGQGLRAEIFSARSTARTPSPLKANYPSPSLRSMCSRNDAFSDFGYIVPRQANSSRQKSARHIHPASKKPPPGV